MADTNGNGKFVSWQKIAGGFGAVLLLVIGALLGHLLTTAVPRSELFILVKQSEERHALMDKHDDQQDAQLDELRRLFAKTSEDLSAIRVALEGKANRQ